MNRDPLPYEVPSPVPDERRFHVPGTVLAKLQFATFDGDELMRFPGNIVAMESHEAEDYLCVRLRR